MDGQYWRPNHVNKRVVADIWLLNSWTLTWEMMRIRNFYCFVYRQHIWLRKWEVIVGDMIDHVGIYGSRVAEGLSAFNVGLVRIGTMSTSCAIGFRWVPQNPIDNKSTLVQVMAWCRQATSHYMSLCWPRFISPYGVTRPQWVKPHVLCSQRCSCYIRT